LKGSRTSAYCPKNRQRTESRLPREDGTCTAKKNGSTRKRKNKRKKKRRLEEINAPDNLLGKTTMQTARRLWSAALGAPGELVLVYFLTANSGIETR
jgi:CelD/BcsL family acetyltransferase involved in cellulose biosynthesis